MSGAGAAPGRERCPPLVPAAFLGRQRPRALAVGRAGVGCGRGRGGLRCAAGPGRAECPAQGHAVRGPRGPARFFAPAQVQLVVKGGEAPGAGASARRLSGANLPASRHRAAARTPVLRQGRSLMPNVFCALRLPPLLLGSAPWLPRELGWLLEARAGRRLHPCLPEPCWAGLPATAAWAVRST